MELLGVQKGDRLTLWDTGMVKPVSAFEPGEPCGHYVIDYKGSAVCAHLSTSFDGKRIQIQTMGYGLPIRVAQFAEVEAILLGKVLPDPEHEAKMASLFKKIEENMSARLDVPHKRRGTAGGRSW